MYPSVRNLTWPDSVSPLDLPGFETQARRLRYQTLGDECHKQNMRYLLLAHHDDDQAETVFMRLAAGHKGFGLQGMRPSVEIPECCGMHGVHQSGVWDLAASRLCWAEEKDPASLNARKLRQMLTRDDIFEKGGVTIMRPLLNFSKARLIETCRARGLVWERDKTNEDTWRTPRNNIRVLLRSAKLPQALQKSSMLQLAKQISDIIEEKNYLVSLILNHCEILLLDVRCGGLIVRLPRKFVTARSPGAAEAWKVYMGKARLTALLLIRRLVQIVTPQEEVSLQSLKQAAVSIFSELTNEDTTADKSIRPTTFTGGGVQFQRLHYPLSAPRSELNPAISGKWEDLDPVFVWKLTRQPFSKAPPTLTVQPSANPESKTAEDSPSWSSWRLWDGRYWIRLLSHSWRPLIIRPFQLSDLGYLRSILTPHRYKEFHRYLLPVAPGKVRWTLLAIAELEDGASPLGRVLALPTLGRAGIFDMGDKNGTNKVQWQVRYKSIKLGNPKANGGVGKISRDSSLITSWKD